MNGFNDFLDNLVAETEKALHNLSNVEGADNAKNLLKEVQDAIKANDIDKLNKILEENGNSIK
jgi:hypothetical protein